MLGFIWSLIGIRLSLAALSEQLRAQLYDPRPRQGKRKAEAGTRGQHTDTGVDSMTEGAFCNFLDSAALEVAWYRWVLSSWAFTLHSAATVPHISKRAELQWKDVYILGSKAT